MLGAQFSQNFFGKARFLSVALDDGMLEPGGFGKKENAARLGLGAPGVSPARQGQSQGGSAGAENHFATGEGECCFAVLHERINGQSQRSGQGRTRVARGTRPKRGPSLQRVDSRMGIGTFDAFPASDAGTARAPATALQKVA